MPLWVYGPEAFLQKVTPYLLALAKLSEVKIYHDESALEKDAPGAPIALVGDIKLLLKIEVDVAAQHTFDVPDKRMVCDRMTVCVHNVFTYRCYPDGESEVPHGVFSSSRSETF